MLKLGILCEKLSHSKIPEIQAKIIEEKCLCKSSYEILEFPQETFAEDFDALKDADLNGVLISAPYRKAVIPLLDDISPLAKYIDVVDTVSFSNGQAKGYNSCYHGFIYLLEKNNIELKGKEAVLLGSGSSTKTIAKALLDQGIVDITIVSRTKQNFHGSYTISYDYFKENNYKNDILINCTPLGMYPYEGSSPISPEFMNTDVAIDLIFDPPQTVFLQNAERLGIKHINGYHMLEGLLEKALEFWQEA
ncbi:MAG: shikimate dehydrogenase family protein [Anaerovoracaceae bacterium]